MSSKPSARNVSGFRFIVATFPGFPEPGIAIAASRAGGIGILNLEFPCALEAAQSAISKIARAARGACGIKLNPLTPEFATRVLSELPDELEWLILAPADRNSLRAIIDRVRGAGRKILLECTCIEHADLGDEFEVAGLIAKGNEAGGYVAEETSYVLLQRLLAKSTRPVFVHGGIGHHTAAACYVAGASGLVLDSQLALTRESRLPDSVKQVFDSMEDDETMCLGGRLGRAFRVYKRPHSKSFVDLIDLEEELSLQPPGPEPVRRWDDAIMSRVGWSDTELNLLPLGQDAAFAASLARCYGTVSGVLKGLKDSIKADLRTLKTRRPLDQGAPLCRAHGTDYPILQGPMTRVSDTAAFVTAVARGGALPFLALAMLRAPQVRKLLEETKQQMGARSWGVGILGFAPPELRREQLDVVREFSPPYALIAGGRPDQVRRLESEGVATYIHVPSPRLLKLFLDDGVRRFVFEGRECGGHVGPRTSFMLWESSVEVLLEAIDKGVPGEQLYVVFAGGIHDARSAAMAAAIAAPLLEQDVHWGVLMGSGYLFTAEAVSSNAIVKGFQQTVLECDHTVLLESAPGHAIRCANTPYIDTFQDKKRRLLRKGEPAEDIRSALDDMSLGRLRIASKGIIRSQEPEQRKGKSHYVQVTGKRQRAEGMYMVGQIATLHDSTFTIADLHRDVAAGGTAILDELPLPFEQVEQDIERTEGAGDDVAIIGIGCLLPGARDVDSLWQNLLYKKEVIREVPTDRWDAALYFDPDPAAGDKIYSKWGGFLDEVAFDPLRYGIPPKAIPSIDPLQLLTLELVDQVLSNAGYGDRDFPRESTSVILGASGGLGDLGMRYSFRANLPLYGCSPADEVQDLLPEWTEDSFAGILLNVAAGRVANRFDLGGVNFVVDAACASSLAALYLGIRELRAGTSDMVIVGGVDTVQSPFGYLCFSKTQALSPRGICSTFDENADGTVISEGLVAVALKRLSDAERDGDRIYAVVKSVAGSSDGRDKGLTAPRPEGQVRALERAYRQADISPATVGLIEAHGTGTVVGDTAEVTSLAKVFQKAGAKRRSCALGSIKSMIGHTKSAAGVAGVMKAALALHNKVLPPTLNVQKPNPGLQDRDCPFFVNTEPTPWLNHNGTPRRAGVSAFGFGGTNFHAVLEEYTGGYLDGNEIDPWPGETFLWKSSAPQELVHSLQELKALLDDANPHSLAELVQHVCQSHSKASRGTTEDALNLAIVASSAEDLRTKLALISNRLSEGGNGAQLESVPGIYVAPAPHKNPHGKLAMLFPGQGSQYPFMLRDVALRFGEIRDAVQMADEVLAGQFAKPLSAYIYPPPPFGADDEGALKRELTDTVIAQPALGAVEMGLYRILTGVGLKPDMVAGHSYGEYVALWAAGVLSDEALIRISEARGRSIKEMVGDHPSGMIAIKADEKRLSGILGNRFQVWLANLNSPRQTILSGRSEDLEQAAQFLQSQGLTTQPIPVACGFHSPLMEPARASLQKHLDLLQLAPPSVRVFSNAMGRSYPDAIEEFPEVLAEHLVRPLRFVEEIEAMYQEGARVFVEVGPRSVVTGLVKTILADKDIVTIPTDVPGRDGLEQLHHVFAQLAVLGFPLKLRQRPEAITRVERSNASPSLWWVSGTRARSSGAGSAAPAGVKSGSHHQPSPGLVSSSSEPPVSPPEHKDSSGQPRPTPVTQTHQQDSSYPSAQRGTNFSGVAPSARNVPASDQVLPNADDIEQVMLGFQRLMSQFLDVQKSVMTSLLEAGTTDVAAMVPLAAHSVYTDDSTTASASTPAPMVLQPERKASEAIVIPAESPPPVQPDRGDQLLALVSERTGYPPEMLDLDVELEADLGIDSIKRVEILVALQKQYPAPLQERIQAVMDELTAAKTLRQAAEILEGVLEAPPAAAATSPEPQDSAAEQTASAHPAAQLLSIVAELTGYPIDMLEPEANLEADLGIDSIKRVEILLAFQKSCSEEEQKKLSENLDALTVKKTLGEVAAAISATLSVEVAEVSAPIPLRAEAADRNGPSLRQQSVAVPSYTLAAVEIEPVPNRAESVTEQLWVVTDDEQGVAVSLLEGLKQRGRRGVLVRHREAASRSSAGVYEADLTSPENVKRILDQVRSQLGPIGAVLHLLPLGKGADFESASLDNWRKGVQRDLKSLYALAKYAGDDLLGSGSKALFAAATGRGGLMDCGVASAQKLTHSGVASFVKTLAVEWPAVVCKVVDLDPSEPASRLAGQLISELNHADGNIEVGYSVNKRVAMETRLDVEQELLCLESSELPGPDWVFLITGGSRGITAELAKYLALHYQPTLILVGLSPLPSGGESDRTHGISDPGKLKAALIDDLKTNGKFPRPKDVEMAYKQLLRNREILENTSELRSLGASVEYHQVDVTDGQAFGDLIDKIYRQHQRLDAVVHGAGIIEDQLALDKEPDSFDRVVHTKLDSAFVLAHKLRPDSLKLLFFMSSVAGTFGNRGQSDYAAANGILNSIAAFLSREWAGRMLSINWGPWDKKGMVSDNVREQLLARGMQMILPQGGAAAFGNELQIADRTRTLVVMGDGPWPRKNAQSPASEVKASVE